MSTQGKTIFALQTSLEVSNFPIRKRANAELKALARVVALRKIENNEARVLRELFPTDRPSISMDPNINESDDLRRDSEVKPTVAATTAAPAAPTEGQPAAEGEHAGDAAAAASAAPTTAQAQEEEDESQASLLYDPLALTTTVKKRHQIVLLDDLIYNIKKKFNAEFEDVHAQKRDEIAKIAERNARIRKILAELKLSEELFTPAVHALETPEAVLTVHDSEVTVPRILTAAEKAAKEEAERREAERLAAEQQDNVRERGVKEMMNNRLEARSDEDIWIDPPKPEFLTALPPESWNDEQKRQAAEVKKAEDELNDLRDKRRKALDAEKTKLHEQIKAGCEAFDQRLRGMFLALLKCYESKHGLMSWFYLCSSVQAQDRYRANHQHTRGDYAEACPVDPD